MTTGPAGPVASLPGESPYLLLLELVDGVTGVTVVA